MRKRKEFKKKKEKKGCTKPGIDSWRERNPRQTLKLTKY
jgi:hypothetical protein